MRVTKLMGVAVVVVGLAVALNALAFKTASVKNAASFTVDSTSNAALAIEAAAPAGTGFTTNGFDSYLSLAIDDKMQPNSTYTFSNVFKITNKAANTATAITGVKYNINPVPAGATVKLYKAGTPIELNNETLASGGSIAVDMEISLTDTAALGDRDFTIVISGNQ